MCRNKILSLNIFLFFYTSTSYEKNVKITGFKYYKIKNEKKKLMD